MRVYVCEIERVGNTNTNIVCGSKTNNRNRETKRLREQKEQKDSEPK